MGRKNPKMWITIIINLRVHIQAEHVIGLFDRTEKSMYVLSNRKDVIKTDISFINAT